MTKRPNKIADLLSVVRQCVEEGRYLETVHAQHRQGQRGIILPDILHVLVTGRHEKSKDKFDQAYGAWNYAIRGMTSSEEDMRVIVSFDEESELLIITAFYVEDRRER